MGGRCCAGKGKDDDALSEIDWQRDFDPVSWQVEESETIGQGSFGIVKRVRHPHHPRLVFAVKCIANVSRFPPDDASRFDTRVDEINGNVAQYRAAAQHPHIVQIYATHWTPETDTLYVVMQLARPLLQERERARKMTPRKKNKKRDLFVSASCSSLDGAEEKKRSPDCDQWLRHMYEALQGVVFLHARNILHCDLKPDNLLLGDQGQVMLGDMGSALCFLDDSSCPVTLHRSQASFACPELVRRKRASAPVAGKPADVWALGMCGYWLLSGGTFPWSDDASIVDIYAAIADPRPLLMPPLLPFDSPCLALLRGMLDKNPSTRWTATQCLSVLDQCI